MPNEEDPKEVAKREVRSPDVQRLLRQFMSVDGPKGTSNAYRANFDQIDWGKKEENPGPPEQFTCYECGNLFPIARATHISGDVLVCSDCEPLLRGGP